MAGERNSLQSEVNSLRAPQFVWKIDITDSRPFLQTPRAIVKGDIWNVGTSACNCRLHVVIYQGAVIAEDTYINVGTINGRYYRSVNSEIFYDGSEITSYEVTPEIV